MGVGSPGGGTLGMRPGGIGAVSPGNKPPVDWAEADSDQASMKMPAIAAKRQTPRPEIPDPTAIVAVLSNEIAAISSHKRSEEHTSELQSLRHLVCRLLLEKKKKKKKKKNKNTYAITINNINIDKTCTSDI